MPKKFEIMYLAAEGPGGAHGQWYAGVLGQQGWSVRLSQRKRSIRPIQPDSAVGQILATVYPGMPLGMEQPSFYILTREVARPKKMTAPKGAAGAASAAATNNVNMNMGVAGAGSAVSEAVAANNAGLSNIVGKMGTMGFANAMRQGGVGAAAQEVQVAAVAEGGQVDSQEDLADLLLGMLVSEPEQGKKGGKRKTRRSKRKSRTLKRRYNKRS